MPADTTIRDHKAWLGYVQQEGLVVSPAALADAQVVLDRNTLPMQERFLPFVTEAAPDGEDPVPAITDFPAFAREFLQWPDDCLYGLDPARPLSESLSVTLQHGENCGQVTFHVKYMFALLQSRIHEVWARFLASCMKDDLRHAASGSFENFPFPVGLDANGAVDQVGREHHEFRAAMMARNDEGLTRTYSRFHDPEETSPDILRLRELHAAMDAAVLAAYGWPDLIPQCHCEFLLDYEDDEDAAEETGRRRKKPWRYRWPDPVRDEVLARLLKLNADRAEQEKPAGLSTAAARPPKAKKRHARSPSAPPAQEDSHRPPPPDVFTWKPSGFSPPHTNFNI